MGEKTKEDTLSGVGTKLGSAATRWSDPYATTKRTEGSEVVGFVEGEFEGGNKLVARRDAIVDAKPVMKRIRPEPDGEICAGKHGANSVRYDQVTTLHRAILVGGISASGKHFVAMFNEEGDHTWVAVEFSALIHVDIFGWALRGMLLEKLSEPIQRSGFGDAGCASFQASEVVRDEDPTCFTIEADEVSSTGSIGGVGAGKGKVN